MSKYSEMTRALFGPKAVRSHEDIDHATQRAVFLVMAVFLGIVAPVYAVAHGLAGRWDYVVLLTAAFLAAVGCFIGAQVTKRYVWPLGIVSTVMAVALTYATLQQGPGIPAAGWWLSIFPFVLAAGGLHRLAIGMVLVFLGAVSYLHATAGLGSAAAASYEDVQTTRRYVAVAGSELLALSLIIVSMRSRKAVAKALEAARVEALEAASIKARFLANMSHEIRTPLTGIIGVADVLGSKDIPASQKAQLVELQRQSASTLLALVNDILDVTKLDARQVTIESRPLDLRQIVFEANELFSMQAFGKGIELSSSCSPNLPLSVFGDPVRLRQILNNLTGNAVKFTAQGGVHLHASIEPVDTEVAPTAAADAAAGKRWFTIEITDTGPGIAKAQQALLFRPFVQADETVARQYGGTGLGLSIAAELAKLMGGRIDLHSVLGEGTTFSVRLPLALESPEAFLDAPKPHADLLVAVGTRGLERHLKAVLHEMRMAPVLVHRLPSEAELAAAATVLVDAPLLKGIDAQAWISRQAAAGKRVAILTPLGVDAVAGSLQNASLVYKPVRRRALEMALLDAPNVAAVGQQALTEPGGSLQGLRVMVADDNPVNQVVVQAMLADLGLDSKVVGDGAEAVELAAAERFDVILMDVNMPRMTGLTAARVLRQRELSFGVERVTILAMPATTEGEDGPACAEAGMDGFLEKPFSLTQLKAALHRTRGSATGTKRPEPAMTVGGKPHAGAPTDA